VLGTTIKPGSGFENPNTRLSLTYTLCRYRKNLFSIDQSYSVINTAQVFPSIWYRGMLEKSVTGVERVWRIIRVGRYF
jgi:hypothetical protein